MDEEQRNPGIVRGLAWEPYIEVIILAELAQVRAGIRTKKQAIEDAADKIAMWVPKLKAAQQNERVLIKWCRDNGVELPEEV
jgi:hypothetical protein